jgi:N-acetylneuraminate synthase
MAKTIQIGNKLIGDNQPIYFIAEIGINHNGSMDQAKKLIDVAVKSGCDAVKFQKRTVEVVYTPEELARPRENPFGQTNGDLKKGLEFGEKEYSEIDQYCKDKNIQWFASCWDEDSVDFIAKFDPPCFKIASASLTDDDLLKHHRKHGKPIILSTGMSTMQQIEHAVEVLGMDDLIVLHSTSTYPAKPKELNMKMVSTLKDIFSVPIGYSGHETGLSPTFIAVVLGAQVIERHITLDRSDWGSDQAASIEPQGLERILVEIRGINTVLGDGVKKVYDSELPIIDKLRRK